MIVLLKKSCIILLRRISLRLSRTERLIQAEDGAVIVLVCILTSVVLIMVAGFALDITRGQIVQARMSSALDAAGLAVEKQVRTIPANNQQNWANAQAQRYFNANFPSGYLGTSNITPIVNPVTADWKTVKLDASSSVPTLLIKSAGPKSMKVGTSTEVTQGGNGNSVELALIMDNSGAMAQPIGGKGSGNPPRIAALQTAADTLINTIFGNNATLPNIYISLVSYADAVLINPVIANNWLSQPFQPLSDFNGCMINRTDANKANDVSPSADSFPRYSGPFDTINQIVISGYGAYNKNHVTSGPDYIPSLKYVTSPIVNGALTNDPTGQMAAMAAISQGNNSIYNGIRLMITDPTVNLPGGRFNDQIDYVANDYNGTPVNNSEMLKIDFGAEYISAFSNLYIGDFFYDPQDSGCKTTPGNPAGCQEAGLWQVFDGNSNMLNQAKIFGILGSTHPNYVTETVQAASPFQVIELTALDDGSRNTNVPAGVPPIKPLGQLLPYPLNGPNAYYYTGSWDNSDFAVRGFDYKPNCSLQQSAFFLQDKNTILNQIASIKPASPTHSNIGMAWGWFALSPNWQGLFNSGLPNVPAAYNNTSVQKVAVILTQGSNQNPPVDDPSFAQICTNMKKDGITIYAIAFDIQSPSVKTLLQNCASSAADYFDTPSAAALNSAFQSIGNTIGTGEIRISK